METTTTTETLQVAETIRAQFGGGTLAMLGAKNLVGDAASLMFSIQGSKATNKIKIELTPADTYTVTFYKYNRSTFECPIVAEVEGVYADNIHAVIESATGLRTRL